MRLGSSGDGKTLMITNVSPIEESVQETICALRFASNVNKCELGKPKRSIEEVNNANVDDIKNVCSQNADANAQKVHHSSIYFMLVTIKT